MESVFDKLFQECGDDKVKECLAKLKPDTSTLQRSTFTKLTKDTLCDTLIFIAGSLFGSGVVDNESEENFLDASSSASVTQDEADKVNTEESNISQAVITEEKRPICQRYLENRCPTGAKGNNCLFDHPKTCRRFLRGGRTGDGCTNWKCPLLHPKICQNSYLFGSCLKQGCKGRHLKSNKKEPMVDDRSFLWQRQLQIQIDKIAEMNLMIVRTLNLSHQQQPIRMWDRAPPGPSIVQPRWGANERQ